MKILIVYASMTGNTENMAGAIADELLGFGFHVDMMEAMSVTYEQWLAYDCLLVGSYTWGDGELPDEILDFYEELDEFWDCESSSVLAGAETGVEVGKFAAVFGSGDSFYRYFAKAVDVFEAILKDRGFHLVCSGLKSDSAYETEETVIARSREFAKKIGEALMALEMRNNTVQFTP